MDAKGDSDAGTSLLELMFVVVLMSVSVAALLNTFGVLQKAIQTARAKSVATNLCREKLEILKNIPYAKLHVTSAADLASPGHDTVIYSPEKVKAIGGSFTRYTVVRRAQEDAGRNMLEVPPDHPDTSLKKILVWVDWRQNGEAKRHSCASFLGDPGRIPLRGTIRGKTYAGPGGAGNELPQTVVVTLDNAVWSAQADAAGEYVLRVTPGLHTLRFSKLGYLNVDAVVDVTSTTVLNATLWPIARASVWGHAYTRDHLLISQVVASTGPASHEYVELYNPSTWTWSLAGFRLAHVDASDAETVLYSFGAGDTIAAGGGFLLVANAASVDFAGVAVAADKVYAVGVPPEYGIPAGVAGGVVLKDSAGAIVDRVAWSRGSPPQDCPTGAREGNCLPLAAGLAEGEQVVRWDDPGALALGPSSGRSWDSGSNGDDFNREVPGATKELSIKYAPQNSGSTFAPATGTPAAGGLVSAEDLLSSPAMIASPTGYFLLTGIATTTASGAAAAWTITVTSGGLVASLGPVGLSAGETRALGTVILATAATSAIVAGTVYSSTGSVLAGIVVQSGAASAITASDGAYRLLVAPGAGLTVSANPSNLNPDYSSRVSPAMDLAAAQSVSGVDFILDAAGRVAGRVVTDAGEAIGRLELLAEAPEGVRRDSVLTEPDGTFVFAGLPMSAIAGVGDYRIVPALDASQSASPGFAPAVVETGTTVDVGTFTISGSLSLVTGRVTESGSPIVTGVLVVASTAPIGADPPVFNEALRNSPLLYYSAHAGSDGAFSLQVRAGPGTYNVCAWYSKPGAAGAFTTIRKAATLDIPSPNGAYTLDFSWP